MTTMSISSGLTPLSLKSFMSRPHGASGVSTGPNQVRAEIEADLVLVQMRLVRLPVVFGDGREEVAGIELEHPVRQHHDLDVADLDHMARHTTLRTSRGINDAQRRDSTGDCAPAPAGR